MTVKTALEALEASLASGGAPQNDDDETPAGDTSGQDDTSTDENDESGDEGDDESGDDAGDEGDESGEDDGQGDEDGEDADGDASGDEDGEGEEGDGAPETPEAKAAREKAEKAAAAKPADILNDPIPKDLNERTKNRITGLVERVKDLEPRAQQGDELFGMIRNSGATADEFGMSLTFLKLKHSDNIEDQRNAYKILFQGLKELAPLVGATLPGVDVLEGHADLQQRVKEGKLDPKDAAEIAHGRNRTKAEGAATQRAAKNRSTAEQRAAANKELEENCRNEMNELGQQLAAVDPHYEKKMRIMQNAPKGSDGLTPFQRIAKAPAQLRVNAFLKAFRGVKYTPKAVPGKNGAGKPGQQPLRAKTIASGSGGVKREPKSAVEAMNHALGLT